LGENGFVHIDEANYDTNMGSEKGFLLLMLFFSRLGFSYNWFVTIIVSLSAFLIIGTLKHFKGNSSFVIACYSMMTFTYDVYQIRFLLAYSIVVYGFRYILSAKPEKKKYIICVLCAMLFHTSSVFYMLFIITPIKIIKIYKIAIPILVLFFIGAFYELGNVLSLLANIIPAQKLISYASYNVEISIFTALFVVALILCMTIIINHIYNNNRTTEMQNLLILNILCIAVIPIIPLTLEFERFLRPILLVDYSIMSTPSYYKRKHWMNLICILFLIASFARVYVIKDIATDVLQYNYFMDILFK